MWPSSVSKNFLISRIKNAFHYRPEIFKEFCYPHSRDSVLIILLSGHAWKRTLLCGWWWWQLPYGLELP
jgi:hypothetical protein